MNAKEMFEALGYTIEIDKYDNVIRFYKYGKSTDYYVEFQLSTNTFSVYSRFRRELTYQYISMEEFKAINKQLQELGWIE